VDASHLDETRTEGSLAQEGRGRLLCKAFGKIREVTDGEIMGDDVETGETKEVPYAMIVSLDDSSRKLVRFLT